MRSKRKKLNFHTLLLLGVVQVIVFLCVLFLNFQDNILTLRSDQNKGDTKTNLINKTEDSSLLQQDSLTEEEKLQDRRYRQDTLIMILILSIFDLIYGCNSFRIIRSLLFLILGIIMVVPTIICLTVNGSMITGFEGFFAFLLLIASGFLCFLRIQEILFKLCTNRRAVNETDDGREDTSSTGSQDKIEHVTTAEDKMTIQEKIPSTGSQDNCGNVDSTEKETKIEDRKEIESTFKNVLLLQEFNRKAKKGTKKEETSSFAPQVENENVANAEKEIETQIIMNQNEMENVQQLQEDKREKDEEAISNNSLQDKSENGDKMDVTKFENVEDLGSKIIITFDKEITMANLNEIKSKRTLQEHGILSLLIFYLHIPTDKTFLEWLITTLYVTCVGALVKEVSFGQDHEWFCYKLLATVIMTIVLLCHEILQMKFRVYFHFQRIENVIQLFSIVFTSIYLGSIFVQGFIKAEVKDPQLISLGKNVTHNIYLIHMAKQDLQLSSNYTNQGLELITQSIKTLSIKTYVNQDIYTDQLLEIVKLEGDLISDLDITIEKMGRFKVILESISESDGILKEIYKGTYSQRAWSFPKLIEEIQDIGESLQSGFQYLEVFEEAYQKENFNAFNILMKKATLHLMNSKIFCEGVFRINLDKSWLIKGSIILNPDENVFWHLPSFGVLCIILASLCPIVLARRIKKFAVHMRIIKKVSQKMITLLLLYVNIITLFKSILVHLMYNTSNVFQHEGYLPAYGKVVAMMVGELTYEESFSPDSVFQQVIFLTFVFILTILLNNLLIGLTTSNVQDVMEEAEKEKTLFMLTDIIDFHENRRDKLELPSEFDIQTVPKKMRDVWNEPLVSKGWRKILFEVLQRISRLNIVATSAEEMCELLVNQKERKLIPVSYVQEIRKTILSISNLD